MVMPDAIIVELLAKGMMAVVGFFYENQDEAVQATQIELEKMTGVLEKLRRQNQEALNDLGEELSKVHSLVLESGLLQLRDEMLEQMSGKVEDSTMRRRIVEIAMLLYCIVRKTAVQQIAVKTQRVVRVPSRDVSRRSESILKSETITVEDTTTVNEIVSRLLDMNDDGLFCEVHHQTEDQMIVNVDAAPRIGARRDNLIAATGALFKLCRSLCNAIRDRRGVYAVSKGDSFARSDRELEHNACLITLHYFWPTLIEFRNHQDFVIEAGKLIQGGSDVDENSIDEFRKLLENKRSKLSMKNVYLLGLTGEGKSTLGNMLTGRDNFNISHAGTGTERISGAIAEGGLLGSESNVIVWDTPGMDDQEGRDRIYESMLYQHLTRENTVSTIIIASKDGSRSPRSLEQVVSVYRRAFGDAFLSCVCVCIGLVEEQQDETLINHRRLFWEQNLMRAFNLTGNEARRRVFFYDARHVEVQSEARRLKNFIRNGKPHLTGTGTVILQGIQRLRNAHLREEEKRDVIRVSEEMFTALRTELQYFQRVKMRFTRDSNRLVEKLTIHLLPNIEERILDFFRKRKNKREVDKVIEIVTNGDRAKQLLSFDFLSHSEMNCQMKIKILANYVKTWDLVLANMGTKSLDTKRGKVQLQSYKLIHLDDNLDHTVFDAVDELLEEMARDPDIVTAFAQ